MNIALCAGVVIALCFFCRWAFPSVKLAVAKSLLDAVCESYRADGVRKGEAAEVAWLRRWSPRTGGWLALTFPDFIACTNKLVSARSAAKEHAEKERVRAELTAERTACLKKLEGCRRFDGRLDEEGFRRLDGWVLPSRLDGDDEVREMLPAIGRCLTHAVRTKLDVEPVQTRRERLDAANSLLRNSWSSRVLTAPGYDGLRKEVAAAVACRAGIVGNGCGDAIRVGDVVVPPGVARTIVVPGGRQDLPRVERPGYMPLSLPSDFDGVTVTYTDSQFSAAPVKVSVPDVGRDVVCRIGDGTAAAGGSFMLLPGDYACVYSRPDHVSQRRTFTVRVNAPMELPMPNEWRSAIPDDREDPGAFSDKAAASPVVHIMETGKSESDVRTMLLRSIRRQCAAKLAVEPVETRQERLDEAGRILTRAVAVDRVVTEEEAASLYEAIERRRKWSVGIVYNDCSLPLLVADRTIPARSRMVLVFENGIPSNWTARLKGCHPKSLMRDFDGRTLRFSDSDFTPKGDINAVPALLETVEKNIVR